MTQHTTAHYFLEGLRELGAEYLFSNLGTDHAPLIEELARHEAEGGAFLKPVLCPHENTAVHMATGYAAVTGKGQVVLVHVDAGTANASMGLHNAFRSRLPVMLIAGRAPFTSHGELLGGRDNYVHFIQEPFDQASLVRPYVKWEGDLPSGLVAKEVLRRAHTVMSSDPPGPVYMTLRREMLTQPWDTTQVAAFAESAYGAHQLGGVDPARIERIVDRLLEAERPLLVTSYAGRHPATLDKLGRFAEMAGVRVVEANPLSNAISHAHPCFAGFSANAFLPEVDLGILLDTDVPWIPDDARPAPNSHWVQIDIDPIKSELPLWPYAAHDRLLADSGRVLEQLTEALSRRADARFKERAAQRVRQYDGEAQARREGLAATAAKPGAKDAISTPYLFASVARHIDDRAILINEGVRSAPAAMAQIPRRQGGTYIGNGGGGLGWSAGTALGAKLAAPDRDVVRVVGDGAFYFGNPTSFFATAHQYGLPTLTVLVDNTGWAAVKAATVRVYPKGEASRQERFQSQLATGMDFTKVAEAAGAFGLRVDDPAEVDAAVARCLQEVRNGRPALLHARITPL
jgi:acetolactate synthase-1/2/3 large subunit